MVLTNPCYERKLILLSFAIILLYLSPLFVLGENAHIRVHDNLDSNIAWYKVLINSGELFGDINAAIPQVINGLPRNALASEFSGIVWLYALFPTMIAYGLSQAITRLVAFWGMYILLKKHFLQNNEWALIRVGAALAFALTPFWPSGMLSTLGMPLALWAFLNIRNGERSWKNIAVLILLPFYSSFVLGFFFFLTGMALLWLWDGISRKGWNFRFLISIALMTLMFLLVEYRLVASFLFTTEPNSRDEYFHARLPLWRVIRLTFKNFILGHTHVMTVHGLFILPVILMALFLIFYRKIWRQEKTFLFLFTLNFVLSAWYAFWFYKGWLPLTQRFHVLDTFNFARFHFLRPLVIYLGFAIALRILWQEKVFSKGMVIAILCLQLVILGMFNDEIIYHKKPSVKEFYATEQFHEIKEFIGLPPETYRVASIGIHPAIAQYNGFYTLDTYNNFYPLSYKYKFRKIIAQELAKNKTIKEYFDEWGGRCYLFTDELGKHYMFKKNSKAKLSNLQLDMTAFKDLEGGYIFSSIPILNAAENQLVLERTFISEKSAWKIYLYRVMEA
ncbi:hypothetical protein SAMN05877753_102283 [Bacillus oleivorans]|uniref:YkoS n=1 Tax=Bacillus oleivorans TaxID=1448271 RepID=A0A285CL24_9BACI|nr:DUF6044 family protein [Bacillus oleivorans]SNX68075.1 hypothetical protein SAMN05877753_102283 [Bacillus oleivorans]